MSATLLSTAQLQERVLVLSCCVMMGRIIIQTQYKPSVNSLAICCPLAHLQRPHSFILATWDPIGTATSFAAHTGSPPDRQLHCRLCLCQYYVFNAMCHCLEGLAYWYLFFFYIFLKVAPAYPDSRYTMA